MASCGRLSTVVNRPVSDEQPCSKSADAIGAQDAILPHIFHNFCRLGFTVLAEGPSA